MTKVMAFGVFDNLHEGHRSFLLQAKMCGDYLIVAVAQDAVVERLKNHKPYFPLHRRMHEIQKERLADEVVPGDLSIGDWEIIQKYNPDIVAVGYDQHHLRLELEMYIKKNALPIELQIMEPFQRGHPHSLHQV